LSSEFLHLLYDSQFACDIVRFFCVLSVMVCFCYCNFG